MLASWFIPLITFSCLGLLLLACIEVGSNDAANLVNAVFGARILKRKPAVFLSGLFVILGGLFSSSVMSTLTEGLFQVQMLDLKSAMSIYISAYLVNTALLFGFSAFGLPVSTTATLVFALSGGAIGVLMDPSIIHQEMLIKVILAIFTSIFVSGIFAFLMQRTLRGIMGKDIANPRKVALHGPWIAGAMLTGLSSYLVTKAFHVPELQSILPSHIFATKSSLIIMLLSYTVLIKIALWIWKDAVTNKLFHFTAVLGMICMAFAFGQNDLANCASPGLATFVLWQNGTTQGSNIDVPTWALLLCGSLMFAGMLTQRAQRVTRAEINTASQYHKVRLYAPAWCIKLATLLMGAVPDLTQGKSLAPKAEKTKEGKKIHYDALRASVILSVSAAVIAGASDWGLPVSTTYVNFAAVIATGWGDRIFTRGSSQIKSARAIWVVFCWFLASILAALSCAVVARLIFKFETIALFGVIGLNLVVRVLIQKWADRHENELKKK